MLDRDGRIPATVPDWSRGVTTEFEFKTYVHQTRDGSETREAIRAEPRMAISFASNLDGAARLRHVMDLTEGAEKPFAVPTRWWRSTLASGAASGDIAVTVAAAPYWLVEGMGIVLSTGTKEIYRTVAGVSGSAITLDAVLGDDVPAGAPVYRAHSAWTNTNMKADLLARDVWRGSANYQVVPGSEPMVFETVVPETFEGAELFIRRPNWREAGDLSLYRMLEEMDPGYGTVFRDSPAANTATAVRFLYSCFDLADADELIAFFHRMKGMRGEFWMPTWIQDIPLASSALVGTSELIVEGTDFFDLYDGSGVWNVASARWSNTDYQTNRITSMSTSSGNTVLVMEDPWDYEVEVDMPLSFCPLWRFATDTLNVQWETDAVAEMTLAMQTLPNDGGA